MDNGANYMRNNKNGKIIVKDHHQQWGCVKDQDSFSSDQFQIWPAKNYACNFCRREFKSAQALGGHMNVHRRDRARLRLFPSWVAVADNNNNNNNHNNNISNNNSSYPNPSFSLSTPPTSCFTFRSSNNNSLSSSSTQDQDLKKLAKPSSGPQDYDHIDDVLHVFKKKKKSNLLTLELKTGDNFEANSNEDGLDLELHL